MSAAHKSSCFLDRTFEIQDDEHTDNPIREAWWGCCAFPFPSSYLQQT